MVARWMRPRILLPLIIILVMLPLSAHLALAQELGEEGEFALREEFRMELNEVGDAHITDTITYDSMWFEEYGYLFEENPNLLSRRYRADSNVGEVDNFDVDIDSGNATITVSFDTPGLAYNLGGGWEIYGYSQYTLVDEGDDEVTLQAYWTLTNEYTLFEPMSLEETVVVVLPEEASNAAFDEGKGTIRYDIPSTTAGAGVLADNKTLFTLIFALLMGLSLILLLYVFTRKTKEPVVPAAVPAGMPAAPQAVPPAQAAPAQVAPAPTAPPAADETADTKNFCRKCGHPRGGADERFCRKCGSPHT
jgi:ribosomal protein L40E